MQSRDRTRRRAVLLAGGTLTAALAGCLGNEEQPAMFAVTVEVPETAVVGEDVTAEWEVTNEGDLEDTQEVVSSAAGEQQASEEVMLAGGERADGAFSVTPESEGALPVTVATDDDEATATVLVEQNTVGQQSWRIVARQYETDGRRRAARNRPGVR